jgi:hypothetical protein
MALLSTRFRAAAFFSASGAALSQEVADCKLDVQSICALEPDTSGSAHSLTDNNWLNIYRNDFLFAQKLYRKIKHTFSVQYTCPDIYVKRKRAIALYILPQLEDTVF